MAEFDVHERRNEFIGGSDVPIIMGISKFKTRYELLLEKAGLQENTFTGNCFTEYGNVLEPKIREYINKTHETNFEPNRVIKDDVRCHSDGFDGFSILEIKTTSQIHSEVNEYKVYLVQLLLYMDVNNVDYGILAVYHRPDDFDENFDCERLQVFEINKQDYSELLNQIYYELDRFRADLARLKENPLLSEEDLQPTELIELSNQVLKIEQQLQAYKELEQQYKTMKQQLYEAMEKHNIKSWRNLNDVKITRVDPVEPTTKLVSVFNEDKFKEENPEMYEQYIEESVKKTTGRAGYVKVTLPKT